METANQSSFDLKSFVVGVLGTLPRLAKRLPTKPELESGSGLSAFRNLDSCFFVHQEKVWFSYIVNHRFMGVTSALVFANLGAAYGTAKSGAGFNSCLQLRSFSDPLAVAALEFSHVFATE